MMGIVVPETCWAYKKHNKIISGSYFFYSSAITMVHGPTNIKRWSLFNFYGLLEGADGGSDCAEELYGYWRMTIWK